jgi:hypothetical protein
LRAVVEIYPRFIIIIRRSTVGVFSNDDVGFLVVFLVCKVEIHRDDDDDDKFARLSQH